VNKSLPEKDDLPPKVFISYSHDNNDHKIWVKELATKLRRNGIDAILDQFSPLGTDLALFMEQGLSEAHKVLCICSSIYNEKANAGISGVNYEKRIICNELMKETSSTWVIPIIRNNISNEKLPKFLSVTKYISFEDDLQFPKNYFELLEQLHNRNRFPPIGLNPFDHDSGVIGQVNEMNQITKNLSSAINHSGKVRFNFIANSGIFTFGSSEYEFKTEWSRARSTAVHAYKDSVYAIAITSENIDLEKFSIHNYDFSSRARTASIGDTLIWINHNGKILFTEIENIQFEDEQKHWIELSYQIASMLETISLSNIKEVIKIETPCE
jgi:hypothetical protein